MSYVKRENLDHHMDSQYNDNSGDYSQQSGQPSQNTITAFLAKLWALVNDPTCDDLIAWDSSGSSFHVYDQARFSREILPRYFKHNNFASFIRQLNMYGFRKMSTIEHGSLKNEHDDVEFAHPHFLRGQESLLESIKRRAPEHQQRADSTALIGVNCFDGKTGRSMEFSRLIEDVRSLQSKQTSLSDKLSYMQTENQALWGEIGSLRQKHARQQQIVSKLMEFLLNFVTNHSHSSHEQAVEQQAPNELLHHEQFAAQQPPHSSQGQHPTNDSSPLVAEQILSPNTLKRKQAVLMLNEEPNKRTTTQQQQQQQQQHYGYPPNLGRQQSVTINELADNDPSALAHAAPVASPLVDLVPSPPLSKQHHDDHHYYSNFQDSRTSHQPNATLSTVANGENSGKNFVPDFILRTDNTNGSGVNLGLANNGATSTGIKTSNPATTKQVPEQQIEVSHPVITNPSTDSLKTSSTLNSNTEHQQQPKLGQLNEAYSFSLDDITGDVDHIQSSLDSIRDLMFESLPEGASIEDLFGEDNELLSPLLHPAGLSKVLVDPLQQHTGTMLGNHPIDQSAQPLTVPGSTGEPGAPSQSVPTVNERLIEHLIDQTTRVEEQQHAINQLARDNSDLQEKVHRLEQQAHQKQ